MKTSTTAFIAASLTFAASLAQSQNLQQTQTSPTASQYQSLASDLTQTDLNLGAAAGVQSGTENGVAFMCGGVGLDEAAYMKHAARDYNLMLTFAERNGKYLADVNVAIKDSKGNPVLQTTCGAPILLVQLPYRGAYSVQARAADITVKRIVHAASNGRTNAIVMTWPQEPNYIYDIAESKRRQQTESSSGSDSSGSAAAGR